MSNGTGPKSSSEKSTKQITTAAKKVKETKSVPITVDLNLLKVLINERPLIPLLRVLKEEQRIAHKRITYHNGKLGIWTILNEKSNKFRFG